MMAKLFSILPSLLPAVGAVLVAFAAHQYGEATHGTMSIVQQLISIWGAGAVGAGSLATGLVVQRGQVVKAKAELPDVPEGTESTEDHLLGLLAQEFARKRDSRLSKLAELFTPVEVQK